MKLAPTIVADRDPIESSSHSSNESDAQPRRSNAPNLARLNREFELAEWDRAEAGDLQPATQYS